MLHEVVALDVEVAREADLAGAGVGVVGVVLYLDQLALPLGVVDDGELERVQHGHGALSVLVQILAQAVLEQGVLHGVGHLGDADALAEVTHSAGGVAAAQAAERGHTRVVPAGDVALLDQLAQLALAHDGVVYAQARELNLPRPVGHGDVVDHPVVERAVRLELQRAERVGYALERVLNGVREVVHGIDAPLAALAVVLKVAYPVNYRVAHVEVAAREVNLRAQGVLIVRELARPHAAEEVEVFLDRPVAPGAAGRGAHVAAVLAELLGRQLADVGETLLYKLLGVLIGLLEIVRAVEEAVAPVEAQPVDVLLDGLDVLGVLLGGVGVVHAEVADAAEALSRAEVYYQRLTVAYVQITVRLGREARVHLLALEPAAGGDVLGDELLYKIAGSFVHVLHPLFKYL